MFFNKKDFFRVFWERCRRHFGRSMWRPERRFGRPSWVRRDPLHCNEPNCHFLYLAFLCYSKTLMIDWPNDCGDTLGAHTGLRGGIVQILINNWDLCNKTLGSNGHGTYCIVKRNDVMFFKTWYRSPSVSCFAFFKFLVILKMLNPQKPNWETSVWTPLILLFAHQTTLATEASEEFFSTGTLSWQPATPTASREVASSSTRRAPRCSGPLTLRATSNNPSLSTSTPWHRELG